MADLPPYITKLNGKYCCSLCRPDRPYCSKAYAFEHVKSDQHKDKVASIERIPVDLYTGRTTAEVEVIKPSIDEKKIQSIVEECLKNHPLIKVLKSTIDIQMNEISALKNKYDDLVEKVRIYKEEADVIDKTAADRKRGLYSEIFRGI